MRSDDLENMKKPTGWGGTRVGSGRKPRLQYEARELFNIAVDAQWDDIMMKIREIVVQGDKDMLRYLIDQRVGRAPQSGSLDITSRGEQIASPSGSVNLAVIAERVAGELARLKLQGF